MRYGFLTAAFAASYSPAFANGLTVYCAILEQDCGEVLEAFKKDTGIESQVVRIGAGEVLACLK